MMILLLSDEQVYLLSATTSHADPSTYMLFYSKGQLASQWETFIEQLVIIYSFLSYQSWIFLLFPHCICVQPLKIATF
jgi:hypothetical protein